jgi:membrane protein implicated in regulation of membrane protease activity
MQSRTWSFIEACTNTIIGFFLSWFFTLTFIWLLDIIMTFNQLWWYTVFMTVVSVVRSYALRRLFNSEFWKRRKEVVHG